MMTLQEWIAENRYSNKIPRRVAALFVKLLVELSIIGVAAIILSLIVSAFLNISGFESESIPQPWVPLFFALLAIGMNMAWCFTSDSQ